MKRSNGFTLSLIILLLFAVLGCTFTDTLGGENTDEEPIIQQVVYVTATPAAPGAPLAVPTNPPPITPPVTAGLTVMPCPVLEDCPGAVSARDFYDVVEPPFEYAFDIPSATQLFVSTGWNAIDLPTLNSNLPYIDFFLEIDGQDYYSELYTVTTTSADQDAPEKLNGVFSVQVVISGWVPHQPHTIHIGYEVAAPINDGWDDYEAGFDVEKILHVCPDGGCPAQ